MKHGKELRFAETSDIPKERSARRDLHMNNFYKLVLLVRLQLSQLSLVLHYCSRFHPCSLFIHAL